MPFVFSTFEVLWSLFRTDDCSHNVIFWGGIENYLQIEIGFISDWDIVLVALVSEDFFIVTLGTDFTYSLWAYGPESCKNKWCAYITND